MKKIKVVWICHFSNNEMNAILKPRNNVPEFSPWITSSIKMLENDDRFDLHIISPFEYISKNKEFKLRGVTYHFFNAFIPFIGRHWPGFLKFDYWSNFTITKLKVKKIVNKIKPDIIHLQTAENAYISSSILPLFGKYPIILTVQGFISQSQNRHGYQVKERIKVEKQIFSKIKYSFYRTDQMKKDILDMNNNIKTFFNSYPIKDIYKDEYAAEEKIYDIVFFARISREKGIYDLLDALAIIKRSIPNLSLCIIGGGNIQEVKEYSDSLKLSNNIIWKGFLPTQIDVYNEVVKAKISVLPTHFDVIPGTIIESMMLKIPVVSYAVGGIPELNKEIETVSLVNKGEIKTLSEKIINLLNNDTLRNQRAEVARNFFIEHYILSNTVIKNQLYEAYSDVISSF